MLNILQQFYIISKSNDYMLSKFANKFGQKSLIFQAKRILKEVY
jgi:hypothetical protein